MLTPQGLLLDLHPVPPNARLVAAGVDLGPVHEDEFFAVVRATERELRRTVREGLFEPERELRFEVDERYDDPEDLLLDIDEGDWGRISERVRARVRRAQGPIDLRDVVVLRSYRAR